MRTWFHAEPRPWVVTRGQVARSLVIILVDISELVDRLPGAVGSVKPHLMRKSTRGKGVIGMKNNSYYEIKDI